MSFWRFRGDIIFGFCISVQEKYIIIGIGVQLFPAHQLDYPKNGDFIVDEKYTFEEAVKKSKENYEALEKLEREVVDL